MAKTLGLPPTWTVAEQGRKGQLTGSHRHKRSEKLFQTVLEQNQCSMIEHNNWHLISVCSWQECFNTRKKYSSPLEWRWTALAIDGRTRWRPGRGAEKWPRNLTPFWSFLTVVPLINPFLSGLWSEASTASPPPTKQSSHHHQPTAHHTTVEEGQKSSDDWPEPVWDRTRASLPSSNTGMLCFWTLGPPGRKSTCLPMMYYPPRFIGRDTRSTECNCPRLYVTLEITWTVIGRTEKPLMVRRAKS